MPKSPSPNRKSCPKHPRGYVAVRPILQRKLPRDLLFRRQRMACNSDVRASSAQSPRYRLQGMSAPQRHGPAMLCQSTSPMRADCALSDENAKDYAAKIPQLIPACFAGERCCPKRGLSSRPPRSSSCRVVIASAVLEAASRELPAMNAGRLKWCCSTACFGASGSA